MEAAGDRDEEDEEERVLSGGGKADMLPYSWMTTLVSRVGLSYQSE
jgi:hypothetical protein